MFRHRRELGRVEGGRKFIVAPVNQTYCVIVPLQNTYLVYDVEKLSVVCRGPEMGEVTALGVLGRYVVAGTPDEVSIHSRGVPLLRVQLPGVPKEIHAMHNNAMRKDSVVVLLRDGRIHRIDVSVSGGKHMDYEGADVLWSAAALDGTPENVQAMLPLDGSSKILLLASGRLHIYCTDARQVIYTLQCAQFGAEEVAEISPSPSPYIVGIAAQSEVLVVHIRKDVVLQRIPSAGVRALSFRTDGGAKEIAMALDTCLVIYCLESAAISATHVLASDAICARYMGSEPFILLSLPNELRLFDSRNSEKLAPVKRRVGVCFGASARVQMRGETLLVCTNSRVYAVAHRKESQNREFVDRQSVGEPVALAVHRKRVIACFRDKPLVLQAAGDDLALATNQIGCAGAVAYFGVHISPCGNFTAVAAEAEDALQITLASAESGFILGAFSARKYLDLWVSGADRTVTLLYPNAIAKHTFGGSAVSLVSIAAGTTGMITGSHSRASFFVADGREIRMLTEQGEVLRCFGTAEGTPYKIRHTRDCEWISLLTRAFGESQCRTKGKSSERTVSVLEVFEVETGALISSTQFPAGVMDALFTGDKQSLLTVQPGRIDLYACTRMPCSRLRLPEGDSGGLLFAGGSASRARMLVEYESLQCPIEDRSERLAPLAAVLVEEENKENEKQPWLGTGEEEKTGKDGESATKYAVDALVADNYPISMLVGYLKAVPDPAGLLSGLVQYLPSHFNIADALINRLVQYRHAEIPRPILESVASRRDAVAEDFVHKYLAVISLARK